MSGPALVLEDLHHTFFRGTPNEQRALEGVDLVMEERDFVMVVGSNGSGKSTMLNAIAGTLIPDQGRVLIGDQDVTQWPESRRAALVGRVFQSPLSGTIGDLTIAENLAVAAKRGMRHGVLRNALVGGRRRELADRVRVAERARVAQLLVLVVLDRAIENVQRVPKRRVEPFDVIEVARLFRNVPADEGPAKPDFSFVVVVDLHPSSLDVGAGLYTGAFAASADAPARSPF